MAYQPSFTIDVHYHPRGFFAACDLSNSGEELLSHTHPMPGAALLELAGKLDRYLDGQAEAQWERRISA